MIFLLSRETVSVPFDLWVMSYCDSLGHLQPMGIHNNNYTSHKEEERKVLSRGQPFLPCRHVSESRVISKSRVGSVYSAREKSGLITDALEVQFSPDHGPDLPDVSVSILHINSSLCFPRFYTIIGQMVANIIKHLPKQKSPGEDNISIPALKFLPKKAILLITQITRKTTLLPWSLETLHSNNLHFQDYSLPENYRHISLLLLL